MLRIDHIGISVLTDNSRYTADANLNSGMNVILAPNSSGKSTLMQSVIYGLGLERMLGPNLDIPMPYAVHDRIRQNPTSDYEKVVSSFVELTLSNTTGMSCTIHRDIVGGADRKLIRAQMGGTSPVERDFFVHDPGSAQNEDGFHQFLAQFVGWELPTVPTFDGREVPLYLETLFPMFFVEQKRGWSTVQGPFPNYFRIQDVNRRVLEFLLDLDAGRARRRLAELRAQLSQLKAQWDGARAELGQNLPAGIRLGRIPNEPTPETANIPSFPVEAFWEGEWQPSDAFIQNVSLEIKDLDREVTNSEAANPSAQEAELASEREALDVANVRLENVRQEFLLVQADSQALSQRIAILESDLVRNQDSAKLEKLGSKLGRAAADHVCPTCHQELSSELMPTVSFAAMATEENISFIRSQLALCQSARSAASTQMRNLQSLYAAVSGDISQRQGRIRQLRASLVRPADSVSRVTIERIVSLQGRIDAVKLARENVDQSADNLRAIAKEYSDVAGELRLVRSQDISPKDQAKLDTFVSDLRADLNSYGFKSFSVGEIELSSDNFRPIVSRREDGGIIERELGFEMSASDSIRMKWAYYLALLSTTRDKGGNHAGLLVFDEPGQQAMETESLRTFLLHCARSISNDRQIVVAATTEKVSDYAAELKELGANVIEFSGFVLQPRPL